MTGLFDLSAHPTAAEFSALDAATEKTAALNTVGHGRKFGVLSVSAKTAAHTIAAANIGQVVQFNSASDQILTLPRDIDATIPVDTEIKVQRIGAGRVLFRPTTENMVRNPNLLLDVADWSARGSSSTFARVSDGSGGYLGRTTTGSSSGSHGHFLQTDTLASLGLKAGDVISCSADLASSLSTQLGLRFSGGGLTVGSDFLGTGVTSGRGKVENVTIPVGADKVTIITQATATATGQTIDMSKVKLERGATASAYLDGNTTGTSWTGTANASVSRGPLIRGNDATLPQYGSIRLHKIAANEWVVQAVVSPEMQPTSLADRDNGRAGMVGPTLPGGKVLLNLAPNTAYGVRICPSRAVAFALLAWAVTTASGSNSPVDVGVYDSALAKIATSGAQTGKLNSTGVQTLAPGAAGVATAGNAYYLFISTSASDVWVAALDTVARLFGTAAPAAEILSKTASYPLPNSLAGASPADIGPILAIRES